MTEADGNMKMRVARTLKWNVVDKLATQVLYAVTGIILARTLSESDFGLIGAILVFQAFATLFVDSGFSSALIQRKNPSESDYSTVLWFNMAIAVVIYIVLYFCAPLIADCFQGDERLIPLSRVMFLTFIINATALVQTSRLMKRMDVRMVAVANSLGLFGGGVAGIYLALTGHGAWALVWQAIVLAVVKSAVLWISTRWRPMFTFSWPALKSFFKVGCGIMGASFLNVLFQNIYSFFIGNRVGLVPLGYYTQADKWSKMGVSSISQILTSSFLPALSDCQDDPRRFASVTAKMNRFTSYLVFPGMAFLAVMATPIFHALFGEKWDASIVLFQLLLVRGIFTVLSAQYHNYVLARGHSRLIVLSELLRDGCALIAIFITLPYIALTHSGSITYGVSLFLWGQVVASFISWAVMLAVTSRLSWRTPWQFLADSIPYASLSLLVALFMVGVGYASSNPWLQLLLQSSVGITLYVTINALLGSRVQNDLLAYLKAHFTKPHKST